MAKTGSAGRQIAEYAAANRARLDLSLQFRHHAIHRERLGTLTVKKQGEAEVARLRISGELLVWINDRLAQMSESPADWGVGRSHPAARISVSSRGRRGETRYEVDEPEWCELDPLPFAVRLVAETASIVDEVSKLLDAEQGLRLSWEAHEDLATIAPEFPFRDEDGQVAVLLSPLSGFIQQAQPTVGQWTARGA